MDGGGVGNDHRGQDVSHRVERRKTLVNGNLEDRRCRIDRTINRADALAVPAPPVAERAFATVPTRCVRGGVQTPRDKLVAAECRRKRRYV
jgi:hypothetical protein